MHLTFGAFVAIGILHADVEDVRAAPHLQASDLGGFLDLAGRDQPLEFAAAEHVGPLADDHRARALVDSQRLDSRNHRALEIDAISRRPPLDHRGERPDMRRRGPAASADQIDPARVNEALELMFEHLRRLVVVAALRRAGRRSARRRPGSARFRKVCADGRS